MKQNSCIEVVTFKGKPTLTIDEVRTALLRTTPYLKQFDGFLSRTISVNEKGDFLDVVRWEDMEKAKRAAASLPQNGELMKLMEVIDFNSVKMEHYTVFSDAP
ncbi:hypothetical protein [Maribacter sp. 2-571]|uniref:hypothetical protein n=1 Tax=Maribacter sp. 2-571 TaxID=3417569 RepID=UPI003D354F35